MRTVIDWSAKAVLRDVTSEGAIDYPERSFEIRDGTRSREVLIDFAAIALPYPEVRLGPKASPAPHLVGTAKLDHETGGESAAWLDAWDSKYSLADDGKLHDPSVPSEDRAPAAYILIDSVQPGAPARRSISGHYDRSLLLHGRCSESLELGSDDGKSTEKRLAIQPVHRLGPSQPRLQPPQPLSLEQRIEWVVQREVLDAAADSSPNASDLEVLVVLTPVEMGSLSQDVADRIAQRPGADPKQVRNTIVEERFAKVRRSQEPFVAGLEQQLGGTVLRRFGFANILSVRLPRASVRAVGGRPDVVCVQFSHEIQLNSADGVTVLAAHRVTPYLQAEYSGGHPNPLLHDHPSIALAVIDLVFEDDHESIAGRVEGAWECSVDACNRVAVGSLDADLVYLPPPALGFPPTAGEVGTRHGNVCAQIAAESARARPPRPIPDSRRYAEERAGASRETALFLYKVALPDEAALRAMEEIAVSGIDVVNASYSVGAPLDRGQSPTPQELYGAGAHSNAVNSLSTYDVIWVTSAGNLGGDLVSRPREPWNSRYSRYLNVTIREPATAAFSVTVGGLMNYDSAYELSLDPAMSPEAALEASHPAPGTIRNPDTSQSDIENASIYFASSRGGLPFMGGTRSVVATAAAAGQYYSAGSQNPARQGMPNLNAYDLYGVGTSFAAPVVAGAACDIRHFWLENAPRVDPVYPLPLVNLPGFTIIQLLLMGDRWTEADTYTFRGFDPSFGNGRFRMRLLDNAHMSPPWRLHIERVQVSRTNAPGVLSFLLNGGAPLPSDVDRLTVVLWWPELPSPLYGFTYGPDIALTVRAIVRDRRASRSWSDDSFDTKKRVYIPAEQMASVRGLEARWEVNIDVRSLPPDIRGPESVPLSRWDLYLAWLYEGSLRFVGPIPEPAPPPGPGLTPRF